jgi:hypothetical protein
VFESLDSAEKPQHKEPPVTTGEALTVYVLILLVAFGSILAFILLGDQPYGMQYATLISYTAVVFVWTFFRTKGVNTKHDLSDPYVQEQLPRLLMIHFVYLLAIFLLETWAFSIRPTLPSWWLIEHGHGRRDMPPFDFALMVSGILIATSQIILSRRILGRAKKEFLAQSEETAQ